ncbi:hypothetical protein CJF31_00006328 [Rutstroemia sp. NJR-2017a BVV2]|nr:hypothetical protein CJF31_00006328 [Rutstroemia sp. NJR-2017a BVV2]
MRLLAYIAPGTWDNVLALHCIPSCGVSSAWNVPTAVHSAFVSLNSKCPVTGTELPTCATQTAAFDSQCCGSISSFGSSLVSCYESNAPKCLDLSALSKSLTQFGATATGDLSYSDPCAKFASATGSSSTASQTGSGKTMTTSSSGGAQTSVTGSAGAAATTSAKSGADSLRGKRELGLGLKVYAGLALVAGLGGLWL